MKASKSQIMKKAIEIARSLEGSWAARMSEGLRLAYQMAKMIAGESVSQIKDSLMWFGADRYGKQTMSEIMETFRHIGNAKVKSIVEMAFDMGKFTEKMAWAVAYAVKF